MKRERAEGLPPVFDGESRVLILGSFPSVKSRAVNFYYGNPQNRFWKTVCGFFSEEVPPDPDGKREFLLRRHIALWDIVERCEIEGSADLSIREVKAADIPWVLAAGKIEVILCNGSTAMRLLERYYPECAAHAKRLPSTSPANPRFSAEAWERALCDVFGGEGHKGNIFRNGVDKAQGKEYNEKKSSAAAEK